jgi:hypothetical protein
MLHGARLVPLTADMAAALVEWMLALRGASPLQGIDAKWAVLQCADTLVWAIRQGDAWMLANKAGSGVRAPRAEVLSELRLFGPESEALVWRVDDEFAGRLLGDESVADELLKPVDRELAFEPPVNAAKEESAPGQWRENRANICEPLEHGFVRRELPNGRVTVTPAGEGILVRDYLADADASGILRVAATRFVKVLHQVHREGR